LAARKGMARGGERAKGRDGRDGRDLKPEKNECSSFVCRCQPRGMELLWQPEITRVYLQLLSSSANEVTVEAALGSLQNLTACTWQVQLYAVF